MRFEIHGPCWKVEVLTCGDDEKQSGWTHFTVWSYCEAPIAREAAVEGLEYALRLLGGGRTLLWRVKPEYEHHRDFEHDTSWWQGFARFSVKVVGGIEHEPAPEEDGPMFLGLGDPA